MKEKVYWISTNEKIERETREILNEYLLSLKLGGKAVSTIDKYRKILEQFLKMCYVPLNKMNSDDVYSWLFPYSKSKSPKTMDLVLSTLSSFFQFCFLEDYMDTIIIKKRWRPKIPHALPKYLTEQEIARVKHTTETLPVRDRALILFLFSTGCRSIEVVHLKLQDVDLERRTAIVNGKGNKKRYVHFSDECAMVLGDYLRSRPYEVDAPLFKNKFNKGLGKSGIYRITTKLGENSGLKIKLSPHIFRHTFGTYMLARGANLEFIADEMGHRDLNTTRIYARIPNEDMRVAYQNKMG